MYASLVEKKIQLKYRFVAFQILIQDTVLKLYLDSKYRTFFRILDTHLDTCISDTSTIEFVLDGALLQWISEYAVRAYTTADSAVTAVSYLHHARIA